MGLFCIAGGGGGVHFPGISIRGSLQAIIEKDIISAFRFLGFQFLELEGSPCSELCVLGDL